MFESFAKKQSKLSLNRRREAGPEQRAQDNMENQVDMDISDQPPQLSPEAREGQNVEIIQESQDNESQDQPEIPVLEISDQPEEQGAQENPAGSDMDQDEAGSVIDDPEAGPSSANNDPVSIVHCIPNYIF